MAYIRRLLNIMTKRPMMKKAAVNRNASEAPMANHTLCENGMLTSINTREKKAVNVTVAIS